MHATLLAPLFAALLLVELPAQSLQEVEPNNTGVTATPLPAGVQAYGHVDYFEIDLYVLTLTATSDLRALTGPGFGTQVGDTILSLFDSNLRVPVVENDDYAGRGYYSQITASALPPGTYYLEVRAANANNAGTYVLEWYAAPPGDLAIYHAPTLESAEPNDPRVSSGVPTSTTMFSRNLGATVAGGASGTAFGTPGVDYDFYAFNATTAGTYVLSTLPTFISGGPAPLDTVLYLVTPAMAVLAMDDDYLSMTTLSQITYTIATPGTYFAVVRSYWGLSGTYICDITGPNFAFPPTTLATFAALPGGCAGSVGTPTLSVRTTNMGGAFQPEKPLLGTEFCVDVTSLPASALTLQVLGVSQLPSPFDLGPLGAPGCILEVDPVVVSLALADSSGVSFWCQRLPYDLTFCGLALEMQVAVLDTAANPLGLTVTGRGRAVLGNSD